MTFTAPLGLLALLGLPAVVVLHLFRRRPVERRVSALFLFGPGQSAAAGRKRSNLLPSASLFLELAAALLLALACGGLSFGSAGAVAHLVVVLDDSASMSAAAPAAAGGVATSAAQRAHAAVRHALAELPRDARVTLVVSGPRPEVLLGPAARRELLEDALRRHVPQQPHHDFGPALQLGLELTAAGDRLLFVTDAPVTNAPPPYRVVAVGAPLANAWIVSPRRLRRGSGEEVVVDVQSSAPSTAPSRRTLELQLAEGAAAARQDVELTPGATTRATLALPAAAANVAVTVRLSPADALPLDDSVTLLPEPRRIVRVENRWNEAATRALQVERLLAVLPDVAAVASGEPGDLVLVHGEDTAPGAAAVLALPAPPDPAAAAPAAEGWRGPFLLEHAEPLLDGLSFDGVVWASPPHDAPGRPLIVAEARVLAADEWRGDTRRVALSLEPTRGDLAAAPDWPILVHDLVEDARRRLPDAATANVRLGEEWTWRRAAGAGIGADVEIVDPEGKPWPVAGGREIVWRARRAGVHRLVARGEEVARFSAAFADARESDLSARASGVREPQEAAMPPVAGVVGRTSGEPERRLLALLALLCAGADWLVLGHGRRRSGR